MLQQVEQLSLRLVQTIRRLGVMLDVRLLLRLVRIDAGSRAILLRQFLVVAVRLDRRLRAILGLLQACT